MVEWNLPGYSWNIRWRCWATLAACCQDQDTRGNAPDWAECGVGVELCSAVHHPPHFLHNYCLSQSLDVHLGLIKHCILWMTNRWLGCTNKKSHLKATDYRPSESRQNGVDPSSYSSPEILYIFKWRHKMWGTTSLAGGSCWELYSTLGQLVISMLGIHQL